MFESATSELRHGSVAGSDIIRPEPADPEDVSRKARSRRARLPRSQSAGNMLEVVGTPDRTVKYEPRDIPRDSSEHRNLRDLAKFFRTTAPPVNIAHDNCITLARSGSSESGDNNNNNKLSIQSMMKRRRAAKRGTQSLQLQLSDKVIAKKTIEGYPYATIAIPNQQDVDGPWFRSQYPVIPRSNSRGLHEPPNWPERTTSRGVLDPSSPTYAVSVDHMRDNCHSSRQSLDHTAQSLEASPDDLKNFTEARLAAASFLCRLTKDTLHAADPESPSQTETAEELARDEMIDQHLQSSPMSPTVCNIGDRGSCKTAVEFPATPPPSGQLQQFQWPEVVTNSIDTSPTASPKTIMSRRRQPSLSSVHRGHASPKSRGPLQTSLTIATGSTLAVPEDNVQPESPGFPKMLAAMEFPSPPRLSRSPSPASTLSSGFPSPPPAQSPPIVRPRTSSKTAMTTPNTPISLNEIIMRPTQPGLLHSQSDHSLGGFANKELVDRNIPINPGLGITARSGVAGEIANLPRQVGPPKFIDDTASLQNASDSTAACLKDNCMPKHLSGSGDYTFYRHSASSISSNTTESHRYSTSTLGNHQATRSDATSVSTTPTLVADGTVLKSNDTAISSQQLVKDLVSDTLQGICSRGFLGTDRTYSDTDSALQVGAIFNSVTSKPMSIAERRMVRQGRSDDFRKRSIDLTRSGPRPLLRTAVSSESVDSPVLGWFSQSTVPTHKASFRGPSPLARMSQSVAISGSSDVRERLEDRSIETGSATEDTCPAQNFFQTPVEALGTAADLVTSENSGNGVWSISPILTAQIEPEPIVAPTIVRDCNLTISPLMVVAVIEPSDVSGVFPTQAVDLRLSGIFTTETTVPPSLPSKSPRRPGYTPKRLSRQLHLPVKIAVNTSETIVPSNAQLPGRSSLPTFPTTIQSRALKRLSLPTHVSGSQTPWTSWDRTSFTRRRETWMPPQQLEEESSSDEAEALPRRRSSIIKERIHKEKMAKEKEIADLVANIASTVPQVEIQAATADDDEQGKDCTTDELELRLQRLEQNSDAWLSVLDPLLSNMTTTLKEMKKDGKGAPLLMGEFMIDMAAEARRSMLSVKSPAETITTVKSPITFDGFDGAHTAVSTKPKSAPESELDGSIRIKKSGGGRSPPNIARLRLPLEQPEEKESQKLPQSVEETPEEPKETVEAETVEADINKPVAQTLVVPERASTDNPRTPQQHEFEAQMAVNKRIQAQEVMMDELMSKWGMPLPRISEDSARTVHTETKPEVSGKPSESKAHSRSSSAATVKPAEENGSGSDTLDATLLDLRSAPLSNIRRGSRRWSSAGERASWKPGDNRSMNVLIQDLRESSRISLESLGDIQNF